MHVWVQAPVVPEPEPAGAPSRFEDKSFVHLGFSQMGVPKMDGL